MPNLKASLKSLLRKIFSQRFISSSKTKLKTLNYSRLGILPAKPDSPQRVDRYLEKLRPVRKKELELMAITSLIRQSNNHDYYDDLLQQLIPERNIKIEDAKFIGDHAKGSSSLNTYRKIKIKGQPLFEKIYFKDHQDLENIRHFQNQVYPLIQGQINVPQITHFFEGELLVATYAEFTELKPIPKSQREAELIRLSKSLFRISEKHEIYTKIKDLPKPVRDYTNNAVPIDNFEQANSRLKEMGLDLNGLKNQIKSSKRVITHASLHHLNAFQNSVLIDWDKFSYYPIGFEQAYLYYRMLRVGEKGDDMMTWLEQHFKEFIPKEDWESFKINFLYFLFAYGTEYFKKGRFKNLEKQLTEELQHLP